MPTKFSKSFKEVKKGEQPKMVHDYIKNKTTEFLFEYINDSNSKPKVRRKCINEIQRRGIKIVWSRTPTSLDIVQ